MCAYQLFFSFIEDKRLFKTKTSAKIYYFVPTFVEPRIKMYATCSYA